MMHAIPPVRAPIPSQNSGGNAGSRPPTTVAKPICSDGDDGGDGGFPRTLALWSSTSPNARRDKISRERNHPSL